jgi:DNA repair protein RecO
LEEHKLDAIVLNTYPAKDSDLVLVLLCKEMGKIRAFARGARKSKKRFFGNIEIFTQAHFSLTKKPEAELYQIESLENKQTPVALRDSLNHFLILSVCFELSNKSTADIDPELKLLFDDLKHLSKIANALTPMDKLIPLAVFYLLKLGKSIGIDPISLSSNFRGDDFDWFRQMSELETPLKYEPLAASLRAFQSLANFLMKSMEININSIESLKLIKLN